MQDTMSDADPEQDVLILPAAYSQGYAHIRVVQAARSDADAESGDLTSPALAQSPEALGPEANAEPEPEAVQDTSEDVQ